MSIRLADWGCGAWLRQHNRQDSRRGLLFQVHRLSVLWIACLSEELSHGFWWCMLLSTSPVNNLIRVQLSVTYHWSRQNRACEHWLGGQIQDVVISLICVVPLILCARFMHICYRVVWEMTCICKCMDVCLCYGVSRLEGMEVVVKHRRQLMHVKCIHELCTIILVFHSYLHHVRGILLLFNDFW